jgi:iron complex transport system substrate-binding protein
VIGTALLAAGCGGSSEGATPDPTSSATAIVATSTSAASTSTTASTVPSSAPASSATSTDDPVAQVTDARGVDVTVSSIDRVIPLDGDVAEIVFALGMGDYVVATDLSATYPPEADALPQIGYQRALNVEPILEFDPTLLLATDIAGPPETIDGLERVGVPLVVVPTDATRDGPANKIVAVSQALGIEDQGIALAAQVDAQIDDAIADRPTLAAPPRVAVLYVRGNDTQLVMGSEYGIHWLVEAAGGDNIADQLGITDTAPITGEALLTAAPDVIIVPQAGLESVDGAEGLLAAVPALAETPAGQRGAILAYDDQLMLGNGPRTGEFLATLIDDLAAVADAHDISTSPSTGDTP